jgi:CelD/BcsL family acetyltransferase involved in cellulose biosynthesis
VTTGQLEQLGPEWEDLASRVGAPPFLFPGWIKAWWDAFGSSRLEIVSVRRDGRLVGLVPVAHRRGALVSPTNWHTPEFGLLVEDEEAKRELAAELVALGSARLDLSFLTTETGLDACLEEGRRRKLSSIVRPIQRSPYAEVDGSIDDYLQQVNRAQLSDVRRRRRRLEETGRLEFSFEDGGSRLRELLAETFRVEASGWKGRAGVAIASDPRTAKFYTEVAEWAAARGMLRLAFLRLDGAAIAAQFQLRQHRTLWGLKTGYDEAYRRFAPGLVLLHESFLHYFDEGVRRYELLGGADAHKTAWATGIDEKARLQLFSRRPAGALQYGIFRVGRPVAKSTLALVRRGAAFPRRKRPR